MPPPNDAVPPQKPNPGNATPAPKPEAAKPGEAPKPEAPKPAAVPPKPAPAAGGVTPPPRSTTPPTPAAPGAKPPAPTPPAPAAGAKPATPPAPAGSSTPPAANKPATPPAATPPAAPGAKPPAAAGNAPRPAAPSPPGTPPPPAGAKPATPASAGAAPRPPTAGSVPPKPATPPAAGTPKPAVPPAKSEAPKPAVPGAPRPAAPGTPPSASKPPASPAKPAAPPAKSDGAPKPAASPAKPAPAPAGKNEAAKPGGPPAPTKPTTPPAKAPAKPAPAAKKPAPSLKPAGGKGGSGGGPRKFGQVLIDLGFIQDEQLWEILEEVKSSGQQTGQVALNKGLITEDQLLQTVAEQRGLKVVNLDETKPQPEAIAMVPETMASVYKVLPLMFKDGVLTVVVGDPNNLSALDDLRNFLGVKEVQAVVASQRALDSGLTKCYAGKEESIIDLIKDLETDFDLGDRLDHRESSIDLSDLMEIQDSAPVRKLLNMVLLMAIKDRASDIHFEPFEDEYKLRYRCDGVMYEMVPPPRHLAMAIASRIKVMANLDIAERRLPQDGRIELNVGGNAVDLRVSVLPTMFGESVVIRVLDRTVVNLDLNNIGMEQEILVPFRHMIHKPNGILLVTGPTGSGKTTTLYSALNELNEITEKIITTEDPVEYEIDGICQVPINSEIGMTFASALRSILRQDPDKILVGEIRDLETAQIAVQAALTGHMVFSTLHTNDAPSTITRLRDMGVEPFLIMATLEGILAQRLVRKICTECRAEYEPSADLLMELNLKSEDIKGKKFYYGRGCERCNNTGHKGRCGLYQLIAINDDLRDLIASGASTDQLRDACRNMGMASLRDAGLRAIFKGVTTVDEVVRETVLDDEG